MKLPIVKSLHIENFTGTAITNADYFNKNAIIGEYDDGRMYATQRPSIDIFEDASATPGIPEKGRGVYFWHDAGASGDRYIVVDNKVYKGNLSTAIHTISGGTKPVYFVEMVNWLVILDPENNEGWYIQNTTPWTTVVQITAADFPGQSNNLAEELVAGGAFLDGRLYVATKTSKIYNSGANSPVTWNLTTDTISAERESDIGVYIDKHRDHVVMFGSRTIEFFYNAGNPAGQSPLSRRRDLFHNTGIMQGDAAWREGDDIYFVGTYPSGPLTVKKLIDFQVQTISTPEIETFITNARLKEKANFVSSGFTAGQRTFYVITFYRIVGGVISASITITFDGISWSIWESSLCDCGKFPLIGWSVRSGSDARVGEGIFANGDLLTVSDIFVPVDTLLSSAYILTDYVQSGYYISTGGTGNNIEMTVRTGPFDGDTNYWKFGHTLEVVGDESSASLNATVKWSDGNSLSFNAGRTVDLSTKQKLTRLGRFKRRNHEVVINIAEQYRIEALEMQLTEGDH